MDLEVERQATAVIDSRVFETVWSGGYETQAEKWGGEEVVG